MKGINWLIAAAAVAILALIWFQVSWMQHSQMLLEEQFNNRVNMALCATVEKLADNPEGCQAIQACCEPEAPEPPDMSFAALMKRPAMEETLTEALGFYQINLPYELSIAPRDCLSSQVPPEFACSLDPILENDSHVLQINFKGKNEYFLNKMGLMIWASIGILIFLCLIFAFATFYLLRQKRMADRNRDFFNQMTHEFRTPLTSIRLASNMLARKEPGMVDNSYLGIIRRECNQLVHQVENVLNLGGIEKGDYHLKKVPVDLAQVAQDVIAGMDLQIRENNAEVEILTPETSGIVKGDALHIGNALRNLIDNALKYSGENPKIRVEIKASGNNWSLAVSDNGKGLSEAETKRIFEKFHRCENAFSSGKKGFGLGLAYVKKIVEMHQGKVSVSSPAGQGARFELLFPSNPAS